MIFLWTSEEIGSINIWNNKDITIANNSFFYRRWYEKNIYFIKDLLNEGGTLMSFKIAHYQKCSKKMAILSKQEEILKEVQTFYSNLYAPLNSENI